MTEKPPAAANVPNDPNLAKVAFLRVWYLGGPGAPRISLALEDGKKAQPARLIEAGLSAGNVIEGYGPRKVGSYTLHVLDGGVVQPINPDEPLPLDKRKLQDPVPVSLDPGVYTTLVLQWKDGKIHAEPLVDKPVAHGASPVVRVLNYSTLPKWSLRLKGAKGAETEIWNSTTGVTGPLNIPVSGPSQIAVYITKENITRNIDVFTNKALPGTEQSVVLHDGLGGWGGYQAVYDANPGESYDAAQIKALAEGPSAQ